MEIREFPGRESMREAALSAGSGFEACRRDDEVEKGAADATRAREVMGWRKEAER